MMENEMTIAELIEQLKTMPSHARVLVVCEDGETLADPRYLGIYGKPEDTGADGEEFIVFAPGEETGIC
jgi:hypothetical protein